MQRLLPKEHIYETETDSDIDLWVPRGGGWGRASGYELLFLDPGAGPLGQGGAFDGLSVQRFTQSAGFPQMARSDLSIR